MADRGEWGGETVGTEITANCPWWMNMEMNQKVNGREGVRERKTKRRERGGKTEREGKRESDAD